MADCNGSSTQKVKVDFPSPDCCEYSGCDPKERSFPMHGCFHVHTSSLCLTKINQYTHTLINVKIHLGTRHIEIKACRTPLKVDENQQLCLCLSCKEKRKNCTWIINLFASKSIYLLIILRCLIFFLL